MVLRKEFHIQGNAGIGQGPSWAFNAFSANQLAKAIAERGLAPTVVTATAEGAAAGATRGSGWGAAAGAALGIGLVTWAWWKSKPKTSEAPQNEANSLSPAQLRCMTNPYDTSVECTVVRSALALIPFSTSWESNPNAARANIRNHATEPPESTSIALPIAATPDTILESTVVPPALLAWCERALVSQMAVHFLWRVVTKYPEWKSIIIDALIAAVENRDNSLSADTAAYYLKRLAVELQWTPRIMPALIKNADFWMVASDLKALSISHPEIFTSEHVAEMAARITSLEGEMYALHRSYLTEAIENLAQIRPDLVITSPSHQP